MCIWFDGIRLLHQYTFFFLQLTNLPWCTAEEMIWILSICIINWCYYYEIYVCIWYTAMIRSSSPSLCSGCRRQTIFVHKMCSFFVLQWWTYNSTAFRPAPSRSIIDHAHSHIVAMISSYLVYRSNHLAIVFQAALLHHLFITFIAIFQISDVKLFLGRGYRWRQQAAGRPWVLRTKILSNGRSVMFGGGDSLMLK